MATVPMDHVKAQIDEGEYLAVRLEDQIRWYDAKSGSSQRGYKRLRITEIVLAATLPLLAALQRDIQYGPLIISLVGVAVAIIGGLLSLNQYQEKWVKYRITCEGLKQEKFRYITRTEPYNGPDAFTLLVSRVENLIAQENNSWTQLSSAAQPGAGGGREGEAGDGARGAGQLRVPLSRPNATGASRETAPAGGEVPAP